jgi:hypothetical protein
VASQQQTFQPTLLRRWPVGQHYVTLTTSDKNNRAWVEYKLIAAGWYIDALWELEARTGELSRLVGEEMALDGALVGIASAFDAAVAGLIGAIEASRGTAGSVPVHHYSWQAAKTLAARPPAVTLACATPVDAALMGASAPTPTGWLAQLRRLRNRAAHQNTLIRHFYRTVGGPAAPQQASQIDVPGRGKENPVPYLRAQLAATRSLCVDILKDSDRINP